MGTNENTEGLDALEGADASQLAALVGQVSDEQLAEGMSNPEGRKFVLDQIFNRMAEHAEPEKIADLDAVIHFKIADAPDGGYDTYEAIFKDGTVTVSDQPTVERAKVAIIAAPVPFIKLVTGQDSGPAMFLSGKLQIKGDLLFASRMTSFFRIPRAA